MSNWLTTPGAAQWLPVLNAAEKIQGIPTDLLARQCYEESGFNPEARNPSGAVGIMQLEPMYFPDAGKNPVNDIATAAAYLAQLHARFTDWQLALAAYDWGPGAVHHWLSAKEAFSAMPAETRNYVTQIVADVPVAGCLCPSEVASA